MTNNDDFQWLSEFPDDEREDEDEPTSVQRASGPKPGLAARPASTINCTKKNTNATFQPWLD